MLMVVKWLVKCLHFHFLFSPADISFLVFWGFSKQKKHNEFLIAHEDSTSD